MTRATQQCLDNGHVTNVPHKDFTEAYRVVCASPKSGATQTSHAHCQYQSDFLSSRIRDAYFTDASTTCRQPLRKGNEGRKAIEKHKGGGEGEEGGREGVGKGHKRGGKGTERGTEGMRNRSVV